jgi:hypothetical protein
MIDDDNFFDKAKHAYNNLQCNNIFEFRHDFARFNLLKKLFVRYTNNELSCIKLIVNHIIILYNVFGNNNTEFLYYRFDEKYWPIITSIIMFLNYDTDETMEYDIKTLELLKEM